MLGPFWVCFTKQMYEEVGRKLPSPTGLNGPHVVFSLRRCQAIGKAKEKKEKNNMLLEQRCSPDAAYWMVVQAERFIPTLMLLCALGRCIWV